MMRPAPCARRLCRATAIATTALLVTALEARADVPMFFVLYELKVVFWWLIPFCIAIEAAALRWIFGLEWERAFRLSTIVNLVTLVLGSLLYVPIVYGVLPAIAPLLEWLEGTGLSGVAMEIGIVVLTPTIFDTIVEMLILRFAFGLSIGPKAVGLFMLANLLTSSILVGALAL